MTRLKILTLIGTRPEAIKMAPVIKELEKYPDQISSYICATAQHRGLLDQVLDVFDIRPDIDLNLMQPDQTLSQLTANLRITDLLADLYFAPTEVSRQNLLREGVPDHAIVLAGIECHQPAERSHPASHRCDTDR